MAQRQQYGLLIALGGVLLAAVQLIQGIQQLAGFTGTTRIIVFLFETGPFLVISLSLILIGYWVTQQAEYETDLSRVVVWGVGSFLLFASVGALLLFSLEVTVSGEILEQTPYVVVNLITVGAVVGVLLGLYDAQSREQKRELRQERDRVEQFANKAADINNYGRELNRSETVEEVSALCIQSLQTFLGLTEMAFVLTDENEQIVVDDTTFGIDDQEIHQLAETARKQESGTVVVRPNDDSGPNAEPMELPAEATSVVLIRLAETPNGTAVLIAVTETELKLNEEDKQLLEFLISHAGTALEGIRTENAPLSSESA